MMAVTDELAIINVKDSPEFFRIVANRMWKEWWEKKGQTEQDVRDGLAKAVVGHPCFGGFVASKSGAYLGSVLVIKSDMEECPQYTPWVAAVFVEPEYRNRGLGAALVAHAAQNAFINGASSVYLCATPKNSPYYEKLGWKKIEDGVGAQEMVVFIKMAP